MLLFLHLSRRRLGLRALSRAGAAPDARPAKAGDRRTNHDRSARAYSQRLHPVAAAQGVPARQQPPSRRGRSRPVVAAAHLPGRDPVGAARRHRRQRPHLAARASSGPCRCSPRRRRRSRLRPAPVAVPLPPAPPPAAAREAPAPGGRAVSAARPACPRPRRPRRACLSYRGPPAGRRGAARQGQVDQGRPDGARQARLSGQGRRRARRRDPPGAARVRAGAQSSGRHGDHAPISSSN